MAQPYVGEIRLFAGNFNPQGWAFCQGQLIPISENDTLFNLIGTTYGGDGQETFGLPDLRGRVPMHMGTFQGTTMTIGEQAGVETVTITSQSTPAHTHALIGSSANGAQATPAGNVLASSTILSLYAQETPGSAMAQTSISTVGGSQPHENMQPYLCLNFIISLYGIYPQPT